MKTLDKYKKKLKIWKWCNKNLGNAILIVYIPTFILSFLIGLFAPILGLIIRIFSLSTVAVGGIVDIEYAENTDYGLMLEKKIAAMENVTEKSVEVLEDSIEYYKENPTKFIDAKTTKSLVRELIEIKKCAKIALKEKKEEQEAKKELEEDFALDV